MCQLSIDESQSQVGSKKSEQASLKFQQLDDLEHQDVEPAFCQQYLDPNMSILSSESQIKHSETDSSDEEEEVYELEKHLDLTAPKRDS